uniref:Putative secreted protein n=1 Tax=Anopheles triannulatus TaxID=58253 RepID=A0A2M4B3V0_9DIPT
MPLIMFSIVAFWGGYCWGEGGIASPPSTCSPITIVWLCWFRCFLANNYLRQGRPRDGFGRRTPVSRNTSGCA